MPVVVRSVILLLFALKASASEAIQSNISWLCDVRMDHERGFATGTISLRVGSQVTLITDRPLNDCYVIPRVRYQVFGIPSDAVTACHHGFGPTSEELYVLHRSGQLLIYRQRESDDRRPGKPRIIKRIRYPASASNPYEECQGMSVRD
jgi:hypothetical protein